MTVSDCPSVISVFIMFAPQPHAQSWLSPRPSEAAEALQRLRIPFAFIGSIPAFRHSTKVNLGHAELGLSKSPPLAIASTSGKNHTQSTTHGIDGYSHCDTATEAPLTSTVTD